MPMARQPAPWAGKRWCRMFDLLQRSRFGGKPVRLFRFQLQDAVWWFAQADRNLDTPGGTTYRAAGIERDDIRQTSEPAKDKLKMRIDYLRDPNASPIDTPSTQALGDLWHPFVPSDKVQVMCLDWMVGDTDPPRMVWAGYVAQPQFSDVQLELTCVPNTAIGEAKNQGPKNQRACWKPPYSTGLDGCNLNPDDFEVPGTVSAIAGLDVTVPAFASAPFSLLQGEFRWRRSVTAHNGAIEIIERRTITAHAGAAVRLLYGGLGLAEALAVTGLPGCPGTWDACAARRADPQNHFGGAYYKPIKNPYDGEAMSWG